ncbi:hypothetical protein NQ314_006242 [Rhamnusium bicolor]|uniref:HTH psq-type domain-containing protein n=1 Tax=Rhamnusium bicolor TaxID=1586634 RepID=A0AAV8Z5T6_9CUCU|nr:hypothetical protein NQ314_006242 [Rhamnusium bicolor]
MDRCQFKRKYKKNKSSSNRKFFTYSEESLKEALHQIRSCQVSIREASRQFRVPRTTLQDRLHGRCGPTLKKTGPQPIMTIEGEKRITEGISKARAVVTEESIRSWFKDEFLDKNHCKEIMENLQRIFNGDESGFMLCPKTGKVLAPRGWKNLYQIKMGNDKENLTVLVVFNASGRICPPLIVFPYIRPPKKLIDKMPDDWVLAKSDTGWMKSEIFLNSYVTTSTTG